MSAPLVQLSDIRKSYGSATDLEVEVLHGIDLALAPGEFTALILAWEADLDERGLAAATREAYGRVARGYLTFLESRGTYALDDADGASVLAFLESLTDRWATSSLFWVVSNFRPFLRFTGRVDLVGAVNLAGVKRSHGILPVLSDDDQQRVVQALSLIHI